MQLTELISPIITERVAPKQAFKAIFVMGPPGSGKNSIIDAHLSHLEFKLDDFDEVMQRYTTLSKKEGEYEHSYQLANQRRDLWLKSFLGLVINTTGRRQNNVLELKKLLEDYGYDTFGIFIRVPYDLAFQRTQRRPQVSTRTADVGRKVGAEYFDKAYVDSVANLKVFKNEFKPTNFAVVVNDPDNPYYEPSLLNLNRSLKRFLRLPAQNSIGQEKLDSFNQ